MNNIYELTESLIGYALDNGFIYQDDIVYIKNRLADHLAIDASLIAKPKRNSTVNIGKLLASISAWAFQNGNLESLSNPYDDLFETALMSILVPLPSTVNRQFNSLYQKSPQQATDWYYNFSKSTDYIKTNRIANNVIWQHQTPYGNMTLAINLAKPEKDPKAIAAAAKMTQTGYPKCLLCAENVGFAGHLNHSARQTHRIINLKLANEDWFFQYSPYMYYDEHTIIVKHEHEPMLINRLTFQRLADFVDYLPHYFIGSNAGLPIVGGSMLAHDHYQGGNYDMPIVAAKSYMEFNKSIFPNVTVDWLNWPLTTLRLRSADKTALIDACETITNKWRLYDNIAYGLIAETSAPHHAITPIMRKIGDDYEIDMVLRSNLTSELYPDGIYHPHPEVHPVKKENIGLIEVMGYAVLPGRLKQTIADLAAGLSTQKQFADLPESCVGFADIYAQLLANYQVGSNAETAVKNTIGDTFILGLHHAGVIKNDQAGKAVMLDFLSTLRCEAI